MNDEETEARRQALILAIQYISQVVPTDPVSPDSVTDVAQKFYRFLTKERGV